MATVHLEEHNGRALVDEEERPLLNTQDQEQCTYGDTLLDVHNEDYLRIGFLNVNGLKKEGWKHKNKAIIKTIKNTTLMLSD